MVHFERMQVEGGALLEAVEQIYSRVFEILQPRSPVPRVTLRFRKYANANSRIRLDKGLLTVEVSDLFETAPLAVQEALAYILLGKLLRKPPEPGMITRYRNYLNRAHVRRSLHVIKQKRGRKLLRSAQGETYDLDEVFEELNFTYFHGLMARPQLGWSAAFSRTILGHYDAAHNTIVLSRILDSAQAPRLIVDFVMFHEMLHLKYPTEHRGTRRCVHTRHFKHAEKEFVDYDKAKAALADFVQSRVKPA